MRVFSIAANTSHADVVEAMRSNDRVPSAVIADFFAGAVENRICDMVRAAYNELYIPPELVADKFVALAINGNTELVGFLLVQTMSITVYET